MLNYGKIIKNKLYCGKVINVVILFFFASILMAEENYVSYKVKSKLFLFYEKISVAKNYNFSASCISNQNDQMQLKVVIPIKGFKSKSEGMDKRARELLRIDQNPDLVFISEFVDIDKLKKMIKGGSGTIYGTLQVGSKKYPLMIPFMVFDKKLQGFVQTKFTYFDIVPPSFGFKGTLAKSYDDFELHYFVNLDNFENNKVLCL